MIESIVSAKAMAPWRSRPLLGVFPGEGIGPEVMRAALDVLDAIESVDGLKIERLVAPPLPKDVIESAALESATAFCRQVFEHHGVVLSGPLGGRGVYELRRRFDLFCKLAPIHPLPAVHTATRFKDHVVRGVSMLVVRDNAEGIYQGEWSEDVQPGPGRVARHAFSYSENQVQRLAQVGTRLAKQADRPLHVVVKDGGLPTVSALWRDVFARTAAAAGVRCLPLNVDLAAYQIIQHPADFAVVVTPNLMGDVLADAAAVFLGSRGMSFSANYSDDGRAVYQTGHGAAKDLAGTDRANPLGQILALAMLLRESHGLADAAARVETAVDQVLRDGWCTDDLAITGGRRVGTRQMGQLVAEAIRRRPA